jgi:transposase
MVADRTPITSVRQDRAQSVGRSAGDPGRDPLHGALWRRLAELPKDFPAWQSVYRWFRCFVRRLLFRTIHDVAMMIDRERSGRKASASAGIVDSQSIKAPAAKVRGFGAGKKIVGRKRHIAVDTDGRLLMVATGSLLLRRIAH